MTRWIVALVAAAIIVVAIYAYQNRECSVGISGSAATLTIRGPGAESGCDDAQRMGAIVGTSTFRLSSAPSGSVICEWQYNNWRYIVRDEGSLKIAGNGICSGRLIPGHD